MPLGPTARVRVCHCPLCARGQNTCPPLLLHLHPCSCISSGKRETSSKSCSCSLFLWPCEGATLRCTAEALATCPELGSSTEKMTEPGKVHPSLSQVCFHLHAVRRKDVSKKRLYSSLSSKYCYCSAWLLGLKGFQFSALSSEYIPFWQRGVSLQLFRRSSGYLRERCDGQIWLLPCAHSNGTRIRGGHSRSLPSLGCPGVSQILCLQLVWFIQHTISVTRDNMGDICCELASFSLRIGLNPHTFNVNC